MSRYNMSRQVIYSIFFLLCAQYQPFITYHYHSQQNSRLVSTTMDVRPSPSAAQDRNTRWLISLSSHNLGDEKLVVVFWRNGVSSQSTAMDMKELIEQDPLLGRFNFWQWWGWRWLLYDEYHGDDNEDYHDYPQVPWDAGIAKQKKRRKSFHQLCCHWDDPVLRGGLIIILSVVLVFVVSYNHSTMVLTNGVKSSQLWQIISPPIVNENLSNFGRWCINIQTNLFA